MSKPILKKSNKNVKIIQKDAAVKNISLKPTKLPTDTHKNKVVILEEKPVSKPVSVSNNNSKKPVFKAVAKKPLVKKPLAKPTAKAEVKKPLTKKPLVKKPEVKPASKPTLAKKPLVKKPELKHAAKKPIAKEEIISALTGKKPVAKPTLVKKPEAKKPAAKPILAKKAKPVVVKEPKVKKEKKAELDKQQDIYGEIRPIFKDYERNDVINNLLRTCINAKKSKIKASFVSKFFNDYSLTEEEAKKIIDTLKENNIEIVYDINIPEGENPEILLTEMLMIKNSNKTESNKSDNIVIQYAKSKMLSAADEIKFINIYKNSKSEEERKYALDKIISSNYRLVIYQAKKYVNKNVDIEDLIQVGMLGFKTALKRFDPSRNIRVSTVAVWWIRQAITRFIGDHGNIIAPPNYIAEIKTTIGKVEQELSDELGRNPNVSELSKRLIALYPDKKQYYSTDRIADLRKIISVPISIESSIGDDDETKVSDLVVDKTSRGVEASAYADARNREIDKKMAEILEPLELRIICMKNGIGEYRDNSFSIEEIAEILNLGKEKVKSIEQKAIRKLKINPAFTKLFGEK